MAAGTFDDPIPTGPFIRMKEIHFNKPAMHLAGLSTMITNFDYSVMTLPGTPYLTTVRRMDTYNLNLFEIASSNMLSYFYENGYIQISDVGSEVVKFAGVAEEEGEVFSVGLFTKYLLNVYNNFSFDLRTFSIAEVDGAFTYGFANGHPVVIRIYESDTAFDLWITNPNSLALPANSFFSFNNGDNVPIRFLDTPI